jgi:hypothetical protein
LSRAARWVARHSGTSIAIGAALIVLGSAVAFLGEPYLLIAAVILILGPLVLAAGVSGRSRIRWLPLAAFVVALWCAFFAGAWVRQALLRFAGHDELCRYLSSSGSTDTNGTTTTDWVVTCPDGTQTFTADPSDVQFTAGLTPVRTVAGGLLGAAPSATVADNTLWYMTLPGIAGTVLVVALAFATPRRRENRPTGLAAG